MATTFTQAQAIPEGSTRRYSATLLGLDGVALEPAQVSSIKFSLRDHGSGVIINDRYRVEVLNQNGGALAAGGAFTMDLSAADTETTSTASLQKRRAIFEVTFAGGKENHEVYFYVQNLKDIPAAAEGAPAESAMVVADDAPAVAVA